MRNFMRASLTLVVVSAAVISTACAGTSSSGGMSGGGLEGNYSDGKGAVSLELKSGGKATLVYMNESNDCTYQSTDKDVTLQCPDITDPMTLGRGSDGMLTSSSLFPPALKKS
jgi:hypothetical protein